MDILKKFDEDKEKSIALEDAFKSCRYPDSLSISLLAADIGATEEDVQVWMNYFSPDPKSRKKSPTLAVFFKIFEDT